MNIERFSAAFILGLCLSAAPYLSLDGSGNSYSQAQAEKGGNGGGNGGGGGGGGGSSSSSNSGGGNAGGSATGLSNSQRPSIVNVVATTGDQAKGQAKTKEAVLASMLGRWNAAKPLEHPAVQAHIANGNFNGTIGMVAAYIVAQNAMDELQISPTFAADLAAAQAVLAAQAAYEGDNTLIPPTPEALAAAMAFMETYNAAFNGLTAAEANMEIYSNRAPWTDIRDDVRLKMGLEPLENDLVVTVAAATP